jgi:YesN/AraC family two-component response regulator
MAYRFLVVDDTSFMRKMATDCLREFGYEVAGEASNGKEAIQLYEELRPDVVMMDLTMPEMSGFDAIKGILAINPDAVVLICSASNQKDLILEAMDAGAKGYLMKPFNSSRMQEVIVKYAEPFLTQQALPETATQSEDLHESPIPEEKDELAEEHELAEEPTTVHAESRNSTYDEKPAAAESGNSTHDEKPASDLYKGNGKLKSFVSSLMCHWQEERNGVMTNYSVVCTESENQLFIEWRDQSDQKQVIPFTIDGFRQLADWLENHLSIRQG